MLHSQCRERTRRGGQAEKAADGWPGDADAGDLIAVRIHPFSGRCYPGCIGGKWEGAVGSLSLWFVMGTKVGGFSCSVDAEGQRMGIVLQVCVVLVAQIFSISSDVLQGQRLSVWHHD